MSLNLDTIWDLVALKYFQFQFLKWYFSLIIVLSEGKYELFLLEAPFNTSPAVAARNTLVTHDILLLNGAPFNG